MTHIGTTPINTYDLLLFTPFSSPFNSLSIVHNIIPF